MTRLLLLALAACTTFEPITRNVCGNGLLEPGEDCDSNDPRCVKCAVTCSTAADCPTTDYTCGTDGECHAPGGALALPINAGTFEVNDLRITDIDKDGAGDVVGVSTSSIVVRHGAASGLLSSLDSFVTPTQLGTTIFGKIDADVSTDLVITSRDGMVPYSSPYGALSPLGVPQSITGMGGELLDIRKAFEVGPLALGVILVDSTSGDVVVGAVDFLNPGTPAAAAPCSAPIPASQLALDRVEIYQVNKKSDATTDVVVALATTTGRVCVTTIHKDSLIAAPVVTDITPASLPTMSHRPLLADLDYDTDRCPALIDADGGTTLTYWDGNMLGTHCAFETSAPAGGHPLAAIPTAQPTATAIGRIPLDPGLAFVASDAIVMTDGVYAYIPLTTSWGAVYKSQRELAGVAYADLDADGDIDAVLYAKGLDDLDILYRSQSPEGFQSYRYDTASEVTSVVLGDFDGNGRADIAYTEKLTDHERLAVAWSTPDLPLPPQLVGEIDNVASIAVLAFPDSVDTLSLCDDLIVLKPPVGSDKPTLELFHGSPQRSLIPYLDPRPGNPKSLLRATAIGRFGGASDDLIGLAETAAADGSVEAWRVTGTANGLTAMSNSAVAVTGLVECPSANTSDVCIADASYLSWAKSSTQDVVLAVDREHHAAVFDPSTSPIAATPASSFVSSIPQNTVVAALATADVDGDGTADLIAAFAPPRGGGGTGAVLVCQLAGGAPASCIDVVPVITAAEPATTVCVDAAPAHVAYRDPTIAPTAGEDLVVLCHDDGSTLYRVHHESDGYHADRLARSAAPLTAIEVGDVTGDGIDDVVALGGEPGSQTLVVLRQCTSRDAQTCQRTTEGGM
jgi:hypothetical protein